MRSYYIFGFLFMVSMFCTMAGISEFFRYAIRYAEIRLEWLIGALVIWMPTIVYNFFI